MRHIPVISFIFCLSLVFNSASMNMRNLVMILDPNKQENYTNISSFANTIELMANLAQQPAIIIIHPSLLENISKRAQRFDALINNKNIPAHFIDPLAEQFGKLLTGKSFKDPLFNKQKFRDQLLFFYHMFNDLYDHLNRRLQKQKNLSLYKSVVKINKEFSALTNPFISNPTYQKLYSFITIDFLCNACLTTYFNFKEWLVYKASANNNSLLVMIPKKYQQAVNSQAPIIPDEILQQLQLTLPDIQLGIKMSKLQNLSSFAEAIQSSGQNSDIGILDTIFITKKDFSNFSYLAPTTKQKKELWLEYLPSWVIYLTGHGSAQPPIIAGIDLPNFKNLLSFLQKDIITKLFFYKTCFGSGKNLNEPYQYENINKEFDYIIISGSLTDASTAVITSKPFDTLHPADVDHTKRTLIFLPRNNFKKFFTDIASYLNHETITLEAQPLTDPALIQQWLNTIEKIRISYLYRQRSSAKINKEFEAFFLTIQKFFDLTQQQQVNAVNWFGKNLPHYIDSSLPLPAFIKELTSFLNSSEIFNKPYVPSHHELDTIIETIHDFKSYIFNTPLIRFPHTGWFSVIDTEKRIGQIDNLLLQRAALQQQKITVHYHWKITYKNNAFTVTRSFFYDKPSSTGKLQPPQLVFTNKKLILLYAAYMPIPIIITGKEFPSFTAMSEQEDNYWFSYLNAADFALSNIIKSFLPDQQAYAKLFIIKKLVCTIDSNAQYSALAADRGKVVTLENVCIFYKKAPTLKAGYPNGIFFVYNNKAYLGAWEPMAISLLGNGTIPNLDLLDDQDTKNSFIKFITNVHEQKLKQTSVDLAPIAQLISKREKGMVPPTLPAHIPGKEFLSHAEFSQQLQQTMQDPQKIAELKTVLKQRITDAQKVLASTRLKPQEKKEISARIKRYQELLTILSSTPAPQKPAERPLPPPLPPREERPLPPLPPLPKPPVIIKPQQTPSLAPALQNLRSSLMKLEKKLGKKG